MEAVETRRCPRCERRLPAACFAWANQAQGRVQAYCRDCQRAYQQTYYARNRQRITARVAHRRREAGAQARPHPPQPPGPGEKWCPRCARVRPLAAFHRDRTRADGRHGWCRDCAGGRGGRHNERNQDALRG
jgi:hypothetical protein